MKSIAKIEAECCHKFERKGRACSSCPLMQVLDKKARKKRLKKARKKLGKAA